MNPVSRVDNVTVIELGPEYESLDDAALSAMRDELFQYATSGAPPCLVLDMSKTTFIGSAFLEALFRTWNRVRNRQGRFALCGLSPLCAEVLHVSKLDTVWEIYPTREAAIDAMH